MPDKNLPLCAQPKTQEPDSLDPGWVTAGTLRPAQPFQPIAPLWQRLPARDANGRRLADFMMLIPGLKRCPDAVIRERLERIHRVLLDYREVVVFVEMNLTLNTLWVSVQARPGLCLEIPCAITAAVPEARLVGQHARTSC